jgi:hypothetical protein
MTKVIVAENVLNKGINEDIAKAVQAEKIEEGEPFVILQTVAIVGKRINGSIVIEKMLPSIV